MSLQCHLSVHVTAMSAVSTCHCSVICHVVNILVVPYSCCLLLHQCFCLSVCLSVCFSPTGLRCCPAAASRGPGATERPTGHPAPHHTGTDTELVTLHGSLLCVHALTVCVCVCLWRVRACGPVCHSAWVRPNMWAQVEEREGIVCCICTLQ